MPEVSIEIGGRVFEVACQDGEEHFLRSAARVLDAEAAALSDQIGRLPETRMLLMAGLMLADKTAGLEEDLHAAEAKLATQATQILKLQAAPAPEPKRIEVPVIPAAVTEAMAGIAARAEALADQLDEQAAG